MTVPRSNRERAVFVDTSAFIALVNKNDQWHEAAKEHFRRMASERTPLVTTNLVVTETHGFLSSRLGPDAASKWLDGLASANLVFELDRHHALTLALLKKHQGADYAYSDAFSFLVMEEMGIRRAFTYDRHFAVYGWSVL